MNKIPLPPPATANGGDSYYSHVRFPRQQWEAFTQIARSRGMKASALLRYLVGETVKQHAPKGGQ